VSRAHEVSPNIHLFDSSAKRAPNAAAVFVLIPAWPPSGSSEWIPAACRAFSAGLSSNTISGISVTFLDFPDQLFAPARRLI